MLDGKSVRWVVPAVDYNYPSQRIRTLNVHEWLVARGVDSKLVISSNEVVAELANASVVVLTQAAGAMPVARWCREQGIATCLDICEDIAVLHGIGATDDIRAVDMMCCCSTVLCAQHGAYGPVIRIPDAYEPFDDSSLVRTEQSRMRVVWCGMQGNTRCLDMLYPILDTVGSELLTISEANKCVHNGIHKVWNLSSWLYDMASADVAICPQMHWLQPAKSNNKVTQAMSMGLPVLASPTVAYMEAIMHGVNGFICYTLDDWFKYLILLRDNIGVRANIGKVAKWSVASGYSIDSIGSIWLGLLSQLMYSRRHDE